MLLLPSCRLKRVGMRDFYSIILRPVPLRLGMALVGVVAYVLPVEPGRVGIVTPPLTDETSFLPKFCWAQNVFVLSRVAWLEQVRPFWLLFVGRGTMIRRGTAHSNDTAGNSNKLSGTCMYKCTPLHL